MRVTIIPEDRWVRRDNDQANLSDWPFDDIDIHAVQWYGEDGEIEYKGRPKPPNVPFFEVAILQPYLEALDAELAAQAAAQAAAEAAAAEAEAPAEPTPSA